MLVPGLLLLGTVRDNRRSALSSSAPNAVLRLGFGRFLVLCRLTLHAGSDRRIVSRIAPQVRENPNTYLACLPRIVRLSHCKLHSSSGFSTVIAMHIRQVPSTLDTCFGTHTFHPAHIVPISATQPHFTRKPGHRTTLPVCARTGGSLSDVVHIRPRNKTPTGLCDVVEMKVSRCTRQGLLLLKCPADLVMA